MRYGPPVNPILHLDEVVLEHHTHGESFEARDGAISERIGARLLGYSLTVVPPGKRAWPFHNHHVNEEMFLVLSGEGTVRIGTEEFPIRAGDVIAAPPGGRDTAHQIINTSSAELRYLSVSTMLPMEVVEYPDSDKVAVRVGPPGADPSLRSYFRVGRSGPTTDYWDGE
jgi:uncharacterized cupin superfamily protein